MSEDDSDVEDEAILGSDIDSKNLHITVAVLQAKVKLISYLLRHDYVLRQEFNPVKMLVYGIVGIILSAVIVAIVSYVVQKA